MNERCSEHGEDEAPWMCECTRKTLAAAVSIMGRLVEKVNTDNEYDEHTCPNDSPCGVCLLVRDAKKFITANGRPERTP